MLKINAIDVYYGKVKALHETSFEVAEGQIVAIIGANGAGKSTILRTVSGLLKPTRGTIEFCGKTISHLAPDDIVRMGAIHCPEERHVWPSMTVKENLLMGAYTRSDRIQINKDMNELFNIFPILAERKNQKAGSFSGGEQQMLAIGRALMGNPKLIMFDEPSLGLSPIMVEQTAQTIKDINSKGVTVLLVEQNAFMALEMCNKAYVMETGRIVMEGSGQELLGNPLVKQRYLGM